VIAIVSTVVADAHTADELAGAITVTQKGGSTEIALPPPGWGIFA
jgi:hypothetical protein